MYNCNLNTPEIASQADIRIFSRDGAHQFFSTQESKDFSLILIYDPNERYLVEEIKRRCSQSVLELEFWDIDTVTKSYSPGPEPQHIRKSLEFAADKTKIVVACHAGISRSSAIAYCIAAERVTTPTE